MTAAMDPIEAAFEAEYEAASRRLRHDMFGRYRERAEPHDPAPGPKRPPDALLIGSFPTESRNKGVKVTRATVSLTRKCDRCGVVTGRLPQAKFCLACSKVKSGGGRKDL